MSSVSQPQNPQLRICLMGQMTVTVGGKPVTISSRKARALLALLVQREGQPQARPTLMGLLWGERADEQARASLRQTLSELRSALGPVSEEAIVATTESVIWAADSAWIDTRMLEKAVRSGNDDAAIAASELYRGELLEGLTVGEVGFEQWLAVERERLRALACTLVARLMELAEARGHVEEALNHGQRLVALDPLQEHVHRALMRLYAAQGRHDAALAQFEKCRHILGSQLGEQPQPETEQLARTIRTQRRGSAVRPILPAPPASEAHQLSSLPAKLTVAVLPFANLTSDRERDFFADGITEDLINALSKIGQLFVISRGSSFVYKGRSVPVQEVAQELGVRFVIEGGVRVSGNRSRVTAQLTDGQTGATIWADRYESVIDDIFAVQDEITRSIALAMQMKLTIGETARLWEGQTKNLRAWEKMVEARSLFNRWTAAHNDLARQRLAEALAIDPNYTGAMAWLGKTHWWDARFNTALDKEDCLRLAEEQIEHIVAIDPEMCAAYVLRSGIALLRHRHDEAESLCARALEIAPSDAFAGAYAGMIRVYAGKDRDALAALHNAMRFSPLAPSWFIYYESWASLWLGDLPAARRFGEAYVDMEPEEPFGFVTMSTVASFEGGEVAAAGWVAKLKDKLPSFSLADVERSQPYKDRSRFERVVAGLRRAGLS